jgi:DNA-binding MarR family transcriptional regulator
MKNQLQALPDLPCMCASFRRAARALTQLYDAELRPLGLRVTQFTILQALSRTPEVSQGKLGRMLALDSTTLTRTLQVMVRRGWIREHRGQDRRERLLRLTKAGQDQLNCGLPAWTRLQARARRELGENRWNDLLHVSTQVTKLATQSVTN